VQCTECFGGFNSESRSSAGMDARFNKVGRGTGQCRLRLGLGMWDGVLGFLAHLPLRRFCFFAAFLLFPFAFFAPTRAAACLRIWSVLTGSVLQCDVRTRGCHGIGADVDVNIPVHFDPSGNKCGF